jgi:glutathione synthase/RimK-type ligase-like ATP-grasp enzyme
MPSIAMVTDKDFPHLSDSDALLLDPLKKRGFETHILSWDKTDVNWSTFDCLVLRSCWDYHLRIDEFLEWINKLEKNKVKVYNPLPVIRWNAHKKYILELSQKGVNCIQTQLFQKKSSCSLKSIFKETNYNQLVVKPAVGASAYNVIKVERNDIDRAQIQIDVLIKEGDILVQPLIKEVKNGELSIIFIDKKYNHTILKKPSGDEFRTNYTFGGAESRIYPETAIINDAMKIIELVPFALLYARIDGIVVDGKFTLMELELIEPHLFLNLNLQATDNFALALKHYCMG